MFGAPRYHCGLTVAIFSLSVATDGTMIAVCKLELSGKLDRVAEKMYL